MWVIKDLKDNSYLCVKNSGIANAKIYVTLKEATKRIKELLPYRPTLKLFKIQIIETEENESTISN